MPNPASTYDVKAAWHPYPYAGDDAEAEAMVQWKLDHAWRALQDELPGLEARMEGGLVSPDSVIHVLVDATLRALRNPEGRSEGSLAIDDYRESWKLDAQSRSSDLYFTAAELRRLSPARTGAFTIRPGR